MDNQEIMTVLQKQQDLIESLNREIERLYKWQDDVLELYPDLDKRMQKYDNCKTKV